MSSEEYEDCDPWCTICNPELIKENEMSSKMIEISEERYEELMQAELFLNCLERAGVDNWDWYGEAQSEYQDIVEAGEY